MSRATPRKNRSQQHQQPSHHGHQRTRSQHLAAQAAVHSQITSDYESDTASYMASHPPVPPATLAQRSNTDLNLSVLKRYLPSITQIKSQAANAVVYTFSSETSAWDKSGIEGTMFVCAQAADGAAGASDEARGCIFILNRRGLDNMVLDLAEVEAIEASEELLIFKLAGETAEGAPRVVGLWIHADEESTRSTNTQLIQSMWRRARELQEATARQGPAHNAAPAAAEDDYGPAMQAIGRKVSLSDLFGR